MTTPDPGKAERTAQKIDNTIKDYLAIQHEQLDSPKMLAEKHNDEKLAITVLILGAGLIAYHFW